MTKQAELIAYLFEGPQMAEAARLLAGDLNLWMQSSSRFTAFIETYRDKIRKKIRVAREPESGLDVRSELEVAYGLLTDRRLAVAYEPYASAKVRGPDFSVTYRDNLVFNIEVARIRADPQEDLEMEAYRARKTERVLRILLDKLGQMQPGMANLLVIHMPVDAARAVDLEGLMQAIKTRVEGKDPGFYALSRYAGPAAFYKDFLHLSGILLWSPAPKCWVNKQARPGLDEKVLRLVSSRAEGASDQPVST